MRPWTGRLLGPRTLVRHAEIHKSLPDRGKRIIRTRAWGQLTSGLMWPVLAAVTTWGSAHEYAAQGLKSDKEVVFAAVTAPGRALAHAADALILRLILIC